MCFRKAFPCTKKPWRLSILEGESRVNETRQEWLSLETKQFIAVLSVFRLKILVTGKEVDIFGRKKREKVVCETSHLSSIILVYGCFFFLQRCSFDLIIWMCHDGSINFDLQVKFYLYVFLFFFFQVCASMKSYCWKKWSNYIWGIFIKFLQFIWFIS